MLPLQTGTLINGRYRLLGRVAEVADAERWIGEDTTLRRKVDLWITAADHPRAAAAQDAARRAALVEDARLPRVLDIGVEDGLQWVITQHDPRARTMLQLVRSAPLPPAEARRLVGEAAQALEGARRHGVHHEALSPELLLRDADGGVLVKGLGIAAALAGVDASGGDAAAQRDTRDLVALLHTGLTGRWPEAHGPRRPSELAEAVPYELDELCAQLGGEEGLRLDGQPVRTPGDLVRVLAPWNSGTVSGRGVVRHAASGTAGGAAAAPDAPTTAIPRASDAVTDAHPTVGNGSQDETTAIPTGSEGAASVDGPASAAAVAGSAPGAAGLTEPTAEGDGSLPEDEVDPANSSDQDAAAGNPGRKQLLLAGAGSLAVAGALALAAVALPGLFSRDDEPDDTAAPSVTAPAGDESGDPTASGEQGASEEDSAEGDDSTATGGSGDGAEESTDESSQPAGESDEAGEETDPGDPGGGAQSPAPTDDSAPGEDEDQSPDPGDAEGGSPEEESGETDTGSGPSEDDTAETDGPDGDGPGSSAPEGGWPIVDIVGYDPDHDGDEHTDWTPRINNPDTDLAWSTHKYKHPPFGGYTDALGLRIDLGEVREVSAVDVGGPRGDWEYEIRVGPSQDILRAVTIGGHRGGGDVTLEADEPAQGRYVFVWFTDTAPTGDGWWHAQLKDITVR
ncbi:hypothetical protein [Kytococcus sedentarius]|uniref:hypothetical protein n=1 Tax=Kytococcus sedentarius TaxID=1276 RepID=UPI0035BC3ABF